MNEFFRSQFSYCPLSWMFKSRILNKNNRLHERCLRLIYNDSTSSFTDLLETDNSVSVRHRNIQVVATKLHTFVNGLSLKLISDLFIYSYIYLFIYSHFKRWFLGSDDPTKKKENHKKENYPFSAFIQSLVPTKKSPKLVNLPLTDETLCLSF